jgi:hypothetical protein
MPEIEDFQTDAQNANDGSQSDATRRLKSLLPWQWPIAFGLFALVIAAAQFPIANAIPTGLFVALLMITAVWAVAFKGYLLYLNYQK